MESKIFFLIKQSGTVWSSNQPPFRPLNTESSPKVSSYYLMWNEACYRRRCDVDKVMEAHERSRMVTVGYRRPLTDKVVHGWTRKGTEGHRSSLKVTKFTEVHRKSRNESSGHGTVSKNSHGLGELRRQQLPVWLPYYSALAHPKGGIGMTSKVR